MYVLSDEGSGKQIQKDPELIKNYHIMNIEL